MEIAALVSGFRDKAHVILWIQKYFFTNSQDKEACMHGQGCYSSKLVAIFKHFYYFFRLIYKTMFH